MIPPLEDNESSVVKHISELSLETTLKQETDTTISEILPKGHPETQSKIHPEIQPVVQPEIQPEPLKSKGLQVVRPDSPPKAGESNMTTNVRKEECRYFKTGNCKFGDTCKNLHSR